VFDWSVALSGQTDSKNPDLARERPVCCIGFKDGSAVTTDETDGQPEQSPDDNSDGADDEQGLFSKSLYGLMWSALDNIGSSGISVVVHIVLARLLAPQAFGLIALGRVAVSFIGLLKDQGFGVALIQRDELEEMHLHVAFWTLLGVGFVLSGLGFVAAPYIAMIFDEPKLGPVLQIMILNVPIASVEAVPKAILKRNLEFKTISIRTMLATIVGGLSAIALAFAGWGVWALVAQSVVSTLTGAVVLWTAVDWLPGFKYSIEHLKHLFSFGVNITGQKIMNFVNRQADDIIIGYFLGTTALGYYSVAYEILNGMTDLLSRTMTDVALPAFSRLQNEIPKLRRAWLGGIQMTGLISFPIFLLYIGVAPELFDVVYGPKWAPAVPASRVLSCIGILHAVALFNPPVLKALGKPEWEFRLSVLNVFGNVIGFTIAAQFGIVWVALAYVVRGYLFTPVELYFVRELIDYDVPDYLKTLAFPLFGGGVMLAAVMALRWYIGDWVPNIALLAISIVTGLSLFAGYAFAFLPDSASQVIQRIREELDFVDTETMDETYHE
jgi:PST family polysaccharide transporter